MPLFMCVHNLFCWAMLVTGLLLAWRIACADVFLVRMLEYRSARQAADRETGESANPMALPAGVRLVRDLPYGNHSQQCMDVYMPLQAGGAPVILMVHGGAWRFGDKSCRAVIENKISRWVSKGCIFISVNYRLLPKAGPLEQAADIASALALAQSRASAWGGDPAKFILMGHSAGAHLVALLSAAPDQAYQSGAQPWLGTVALDSAALDVAGVMRAQHERLYDSAFGDDPVYWHAASPLDRLSGTAVSLLAVCSAQHGDAYAQALRFASRAQSLQVRVQVLQQDLSHRQLDQQLGVAGDYTNAVETFMSSLDAVVLQTLIRPTGDLQ